ncbi:MAG TPA: hypothetical protein VIL65_15155 [Beijerinckiaceae bacterium]|jgi:hypothetical protein
MRTLVALAASLVPVLAPLGAFAEPAAPIRLAQVQLNVCGVPPLPPCRPQVEERRVIIERERPRRGYAEEFGTQCRTRTLRCRIDEPRPVGARCICEDEDGEEIVGRVR